MDDNILKWFEQGRRLELDAWLGNDPEKANALFQLIRSRHALQSIEQAVSPPTSPVEFAVRILGEHLQFLKGNEFLLPEEALATRGTELVETAEQPKVHSFLWGSFGFCEPENDQKCLELCITKPFKTFSVKRNNKDYARYHASRKKVLRLVLPSGYYRLRLDHDVIRLNIF